MKMQNVRKKLRQWTLMRALLWMMLIALIGTSLGCYGSFPLTRMTYELNDEIGDNFHNQRTNDFVDTLTMWVFVIFPVYEFAMLGDAVILNLIEFWTEDEVKINVSHQENPPIPMIPAAQTQVP